MLLSEISKTTTIFDVQPIIQHFANTINAENNRIKQENTALKEEILRVQQEKDFITKLNARNMEICSRLNRKVEKYKKFIMNNYFLIETEEDLTRIQKGCPESFNFNALCFARRIESNNVPKLFIPCLKIKLSEK